MLIGEVRPGSYRDSIVLMELQVSLSELAGVLDAGVVMATRSNLDVLAENDLLFEDAAAASEEDLVIALRVESEAAGRSALDKVDQLLTVRRRASAGEFPPHSLAAAIELLPEARWVHISVPGRYAADLTRDALRLGRSVFLFSDNVSLEDEIELKRQAARTGTMVMGPDCGTAMIGGAGFGFANRVRPGTIGLVASSGTGLQTVACLIHNRGGGISHILGSGGRDLNAAIGAATTLQALELLGNDPGTEAVVLLSKPPEPEVAQRVIDRVSGLGKPAVIYFQGLEPPAESPTRVAFARNLTEVVDLVLAATDLDPAGKEVHGNEDETPQPASTQTDARYLRALFSGGTLALEMLLALRPGLEALHSNLPLDGILPLGSAVSSQRHTVLDLGADELTVGRLHPMIDFDLRLRRLAREAADPRVAMVFLDVVLGDGAHPDPATALEAGIESASKTTEIVALVIGTDEDPQNAQQVCQRLTTAGARVFRDPKSAFSYVASRLGRDASSEGPSTEDRTEPPSYSRVSGVESGNTENGHQNTTTKRPAAELLSTPVKVINVGLELFRDSLAAQGVETVHVDWRPPAGGNQRLMDILAKMKSRG